MSAEFVNAAKGACPSSSLVFVQADLDRWGLRDVSLRPYQLDGVCWLAERHTVGHGCILGDEMGLGKTLQSISLLVYLHKHVRNEGPFLILVPLSVIKNWESELSRFSPQLRVLNYSGGKEAREEEKAKIISTVHAQEWNRAKFPFHILLAHYEVAIKDAAFLQKFPWQCLIVDEGHRLKNSSSVLYNVLKEFSVKFGMLLTGTPVQNNLDELYSLLSFVAPKTFPLTKLERFLCAFENVKDKQIASALHTVLKPFILRRVKNEVLLDLPMKSEVILYTGLSTLQKKLYKAVLTKDIAAFGTGGRTRLMNILTQLRKCVDHPYLFDGVEPEPFQLGEHLVTASGKLFLIDKLLGFLKSKGHRVLIFSQMTRMLDIIQDYLGFRGYSYERLDGSVRGEERFLAVQNFTEDEQTFIFLLSTRAGGQGLNLAGADTILFVDSDFNPQNDLQAAARAHRIGQTRPVKVVRLVGRDTVEEIILQRSYAKLELTNAVIEGGQLSSGTSERGPGLPEDSTQLVDILKVGLDHLLQSEESSVVDEEDLESIIGRSHNGRWEVTDHRDKKEPRGAAGEGGEEFNAPENLYMYEGKDYSRPSNEDKKTFEQLLAEQLRVTEDREGVEERVLRSEHRVALHLGESSWTRKRPLTPQQLEERRKKREETRLKRQKMMEEKEQQKLEEKRKKKLEHWKRNGYSSLNVALDSESSEEEGEEEGAEPEAVDIRYVVGDVTRPQNTEQSDAIVVHCVDDSGRWGRGGLFSALSSHSPRPQALYEEAGRMRDLALGDAHIVAMDDVISRDDGCDLVALLVSQSRDREGQLSGIKLSALSTGLQRVAKVAKKRNASVHLPRIGHSTPLFNWYGTERLIRKHLSSEGIPTSIYYYKRSAPIPAPQAVHSDAGPSALLTSPSDAPADPEPLAPSLLPAGCDPLPDLFCGLVFGFQGVSAEERKRLKRFILAYDGEVREDTSSPQVTHIVCEEGTEWPDRSCVKIVSVKWLEQCLHQGFIAQSP